jgi:hypothetical protein
VAGTNEGLRGKIAGEVVSKAPCARLEKEWTQRKLSTLAWARSHATDNALQAPASSTTSKTFTSSTSSTSSMNPLVSNVSYALYAASPLPMLGPGADVLRQESFRQGKAWSTGSFKNYATQVSWARDVVAIPLPVHPDVVAMWVAKTL